MIEFRIFPLLFVVALLTFGAIFRFMNIVAAMAIDARRTQFHLELTLLVTAVAGGIGVTAAQRKMGIAVVIKINGFPGFFIVATLALIAVLATMHIVDGVTGDAGLRCVLEALRGMAGGTINRLMGTLQRKCCFVVIEAGLAPLRGGMAALALLAQPTAVRIRFFVTPKTGTRRLAKFLAG